FGNLHVQTAQAEAGLAACLQVIGDYAASRKHYEAAEAALAGLENVPAQTRAMIANNFANLLEDVGDVEASIERYHTALAAMGDIPAAQHNRAIALANLGGAEAAIERYEQSTADFRAAIELCERVDGKDSPCAAQARDGVAVNDLAQRRYADAERAF